jgi:predicted acyltransferase
VSAPANRWVGLDALRGLAIASMILVNNPGRWGAQYQYGPLRHAEWHGCTFTDLVFPTFLFCAGVAIVPGFTRKLASEAPRGPLAFGIGKRVLWLVLLGMFLSAFPLITFAADKELFAPLWRTRFPGVLQRIGICYGIAALLFLFTKTAVQRMVLFGCLLGYWAIVTLVPVPGVGAPDLGDPMTTLQGYLDRLVFGTHIWVKGKYDPEGLLSTMPAIATCLLGVEAGRVLVSTREPLAKVRMLLLGGAALLAIGYAWSFVFPFNKALWTSSYAVWAAGIAMVTLAATQWLFDVRGLHRLAHPLQVYGVNALLVFVGSGVVGRIVGSLWTVTVNSKPVAIKEWFFRTVLLPIGDPQFASLLFALLWILGWYAVLAQLFRRGIVWKV